MAAGDARDRLDAATAGLDPPLAVVDLDAFDANAAELVRRAGGMPIRVATKSVRCRPLLDRVLAKPGFRGLMAFTLPEALWLADAGHDDLLVAYPTADRAALRRLAADAGLSRVVTITVDDPAQLNLVDGALSEVRPRHDVRVCIDLDASWRVLGMHVGARRSPVHAPGQAAALARAIVDRAGFRLVGVMSYEAQIAGWATGEPPSGGCNVAPPSSWPPGGPRRWKRSARWSPWSS